ncbi:hypothetical protein PPL_11166 [Heterostelium album PN500]|uniref:O-GlcNAc transferase C-terminal domain-containing protein n=1 Tax=Heterostelium pallidum (strain ATCC 26659 / Pp 5 / PN500) TaxID=670386 RepID=D3BTQ6_HETP5|nr:hypothetical protein PPL_11166 [Heterostelium album PN500]EFA75092.1 hypothetical protein PPL_11166 [Heterostelium album PN500]|eukprot:XP_020427226.1 hypothetical protein PPL_11166 [Heterostelium album PN500]
MSSSQKNSSGNGSVNTIVVPKEQQTLVDKVRTLLLETPSKVTKEDQKIHFKTLFELTARLIEMDPLNNHYRELKAVSIFSFVDHCALPPQMAIAKLEEAVQIAPNVKFIKDRLNAFKQNNKISTFPPSSTNDNNNNNNNNRSKEVESNGSKKQMSIQLFARAIESHMKGDLNMSFHYSVAAHENDPENKEVNLHLGTLYAKQGKFPHANKHIDMAIKGKPTLYDAHVEKASLEQKEGETTNAIKRLSVLFKSSETTQDLKKRALLLKIFFMNYAEQYNNEKDIYEESILYHKFLNIKPYTLKQSSIKVAYLSSHFCEHPIAYFMDGILKCHNKETFEIHLISMGTQFDDFTKKFIGYVGEKNFHVMRGSCEKVAAAIRDMKITILNCLDVHTERDGEIASYRPAPIIVNYLGYPNTSGIADLIQYRITDQYADPLDTKQLWTEKLIRMPSTFLCFDASHIITHPITAQSPFEKNGYITFGCYNTLSKVQKGTWAVWKLILDRLPTARIAIKAPLFIVESAAQAYLKKLADIGVDTTRVLLKTYSMETGNHYDSYNEMDISLDPFPYNGTTTSLDSLWMGVPFVSMSGVTHVHNVGRSILTNVGLKELVGSNPEEYVNIAVQLASDTEKLKYLRTNLRNILSKSPISNPKQFTIDLEDKYILMFNEAL